MKTTAIAVALLLIPIGAAAATTDEEGVVVYTNVDVEKLEPLPTGGLVTDTELDAEAWAFVAAFVERERAKINEDRDHDLERDRVEIEAERPVGYGERYPYYLRVPFYDPLPRTPRVKTVAGPDADDGGPPPHPMFVERPPVREFVPGLGDSFRGRGKK